MNNIYKYVKCSLFLICLFNVPLFGVPKPQDPTNITCPPLNKDDLNNPKSPYYNRVPGYFVSPEFGYAIFSKPSFKVESVDIVTPTANFKDLGCDQEVCITQLTCTYKLHYKEHHKKKTSPYTITSTTTINNN